MGCGASVQQTPNEGVQQAVEPEVDTWATKTAASADVADAHGATGTAGKGGHLQLKHEQNCVLTDADDNDEIEIIYEAQPKRQNQIRPAAANGQEAPDATEMDTISMVNQPKPLSKQQQEEAAKLAERRKRFDNQRYQREQGKGDAPSEISPLSPNPGPIYNQNSKPTTDMILGLNLSELGSKDQDPGGSFLSGGILDEQEDFLSPAQMNVNKHKHMHDDIKSTGFDADDERLMKEILDNCDDA